MPENLLQIPVQIARDAKRDVVDCIDGCSNTELIACSALLGVAVVFTPHLLALNGAISLLGSAGRAGHRRSRFYGVCHAYCLESGKSANTAEVEAIQF